MQEFIVGGYIPGSDAKLTFGGYLLMVGILIIIGVATRILARIFLNTNRKKKLLMFTKKLTAKISALATTSTHQLTSFGKTLSPYNRNSSNK